MMQGPIGELLPHAGAMILLDGIEQLERERIVCTKLVRGDELFAEADGQLPAWLGVELMAQTIAAWAGAHAALCLQRRCVCGR
jgi:predicted hotdog family 3-hydroxylacyl-ACP dehydratase